MLSAIRAFAKSWIAWVIFGALLISFALVGNVRDVIAPSLSTWVIAAGSRKVEGPEFKSAFERFKTQQEQQSQQPPMTLEQAVQMGMDRYVLTGMASETAMFEFFGKIGLKPSNDLVAAQIRKIPAFFDPVTQKFDRKAYVALLAKNDMTPKSFEQNARDQIAAGQFFFGAANGLRLPRAYTAVFAAVQLQQHDGVYFVIDGRTVGGVKTPTDDEMRAYLTQHKIMLPEMRVISVVRFSPKDAAAAVKVDEAQLRKLYDFSKDTLSTPETRSVVQIPVKDQKTAQAVSDRLKKGEDPAAVARALKVDPVVYDGKPKSAITDRRVADAAFALPDGGISRPVQGDLSWAVVKVTGVTPGKEMSFEEARPKLEEQLKAKDAATIAYNQSDKYDKAHNAGQPMAAAAAAAGAKVTTFGPVSKEGMGPNTKAVEGVDPKVLEAAFALPAGGESDLQDAGEGEYFAVKVEKVLPSAAPDLNLVRGDLAKVMMDQQLQEKLIAKGKELTERIKKGESIEAVAASAGAKVVHVTGLDQVSAQNHAKDLGGDFLKLLIQGKPGDVFVARAPDNKAALMIGKVEAVRPGDMQDVAKYTESLRPQLSVAYQRDLSDALTAAASAAVHAKTDINRARKAIGMSDEDIAKNDPKKQGKGDKSKLSLTP